LQPDDDIVCQDCFEFYQWKYEGGYDEADELYEQAVLELYNLLLGPITHARILDLLHISIKASVIIVDIPFLHHFLALQEIS
jgi:hypothetical protein